MSFEFRTKDERYKGHRLVPNGSAINQAQIFVDHLPAGFSATPYNPQLTKDRYSRRPRYVIHAHIIVHKDGSGLSFIPIKGLPGTNAEAVQRIATTSIEKEGLDIILEDHGQEYQGTLYPVPESKDHPQLLRRLREQR
jgi:hypothetical protein